MLPFKEIFMSNEILAFFSHTHTSLGLNPVFQRADILISRTIRHILRVHDARATLFPEECRAFNRKFRFTDNADLVGSPEPL